MRYHADKFFECIKPWRVLISVTDWADFAFSDYSLRLQISQAKQLKGESMKIYVKTLNGDTHTVDVESMADIGNVRKYLEKKGVSIAEKKPLIISYNEFKPERALLGTPLPPVPKPQNRDDLPPQTSEKILVASNPNEKLYIYAPNRQQYITVEALKRYVDDHPDVPNVIAPLLPTYTLAYKRYWNRIDFQKIPGPQTFEYTKETTEGMSQTDEDTFSAELGVSVSGLSGKLSETFSHSITVSTSTSVRHTYHIEVPAGKEGLWILWQLIEEVVAVDASGKQIQYHGTLILVPTEHMRLPEPISIASTRAILESSAYAADITLFDR